MTNEFRLENGLLSVSKLQAVGIIWCQGTTKQKVRELFEIVNPNSDQISSSNKVFKPLLFEIFDLATEMVFRVEPQFSNSEHSVSTEKIE